MNALYDPALVARVSAKWSVKKLKLFSWLTATRL